MIEEIQKIQQEEGIEPSIPTEEIRNLYDFHNYEMSELVDEYNGLSLSKYKQFKDNHNDKYKSPELLETIKNKITNKIINL